MADKRELTFSINSRLLEELGENLVTKNHVALAELIKNAYDADATEVQIEFRNARQRKDGESQIRIKDNGTGMTFAEVREHWMQIATPDKIRNPKSTVYGREKAGNKGIGRFACRRLAKELELTTVAEPEGDSATLQKTSFHIRWEDYSEENQIEEVPVDVTVEEVEDEPTGVDLRLNNLTDKWNQQSFDTLRRNVLTLSIVGERQREGKPVDPGFNIKFDAPEFEKGEGTLLEQFHEAGWGCLEGTIDSDGEVHLNLEAKLIGEREFTLPKHVSGLPDAKFKISFIPRDTKEHYRDPQTLSLTNAREIMDEHAGVRVYQSGFRVFPYGDPDDDWLGIQHYHAERVGSPDEVFEPLQDNLDYHLEFDRAMLVHPRNEQLVGRVNVSSDADLEQKTDREGFIQSDTFDDLREALRLSLQWMTLQYSHYRHEKSKRERQKAAEKLQEELEDTGSDLDVGTDPDVDASFQIIQHVNEDVVDENPENEGEISNEMVEQATARIKTDIENKESQIRFYQSAFSVTQLIFNFSHELRGMIGILGTKAGTLERIADGLPEEEKTELEDVAAELYSVRERIQDQMEMYGALMDQGREQEGSPQEVQDVVGDVRSTVQPVLDYHNIDLDSDVSAALETPKMLGSELYSVLLNLVTNSVKATIAADTEENRILVKANEIEDGVRLRVFDTGIGISEGQQDVAFQELVTDPSNELYPSLRDEIPEDLIELIGSGTGLGLPIVRNIAQDHGGNAGFVDAEDWSTCVEVTLYEQ